MTAAQFHLNGSMIDRQNDRPGLLSTGSRSVLAQTETGGLYSPTPMPNQSENCLCVRLPCQHSSSLQRRPIENSMESSRRRERSVMRSTASKMIVGAFASVMLLAVSGCSGQPLSTREKGTGIGALAGSATGAIIGAAVGAPGAGAAIGGALGAGGGFLLGNALQNQQVQTQQTQSQIESQQREIEQQRREIENLKQQQETE